MQADESDINLHDLSELCPTRLSFFGGVAAARQLDAATSAVDGGLHGRAFGDVTTKSFKLMLSWRGLHGMSLTVAGLFRLSGLCALHYLTMQAQGPSQRDFDLHPQHSEGQVICAVHGQIYLMRPVRTLRVGVDRQMSALHSSQLTVVCNESDVTWP